MEYNVVMEHVSELFSARHSLVHEFGNWSLSSEEQVSREWLKIRAIRILLMLLKVDLADWGGILILSPWGRPKR
jgi:hypothetical protein